MYVYFFYWLINYLSILIYLTDLYEWSIINRSLIITTKYLPFNSDKIPFHDLIEKLFSFWNHQLCSHWFTQGNTIYMMHGLFGSPEASCTNKTEISWTICGTKTYVIKYETGKYQEIYLIDYVYNYKINNRKFNTLNRHKTFIISKI